MPSASLPKPLRGTRIVSLALNLPGPAALLRLKALGATCLKVEPPTGDPMRHYSDTGYRALHQGVRRVTLNLKEDSGQAALHKGLARADLLITSFRPAALHKLGLGWRALQRRHPQLSLVSIVGAPGAAADAPGHDLTYQAEAGLITGGELPPTLLADMAGALLASEAALTVLMTARQRGRGVMQEVALSTGAQWMALPRAWGAMAPDTPLGGAHAGYRVYPCKDGRVALAALEPHFMAALATAARLPAGMAQAPSDPATHTAVAAWLAGKTRRQINTLAQKHDLPLHTLPPAAG
ncbi:CoA transferase [Comamonadaceae bacterium OH2545_COT-014]|nr:CoA transferase [Comamonadaceae bacterium OH2545_COT-014]